MLVVYIYIVVVVVDAVVDDVVVVVVGYLNKMILAIYGILHASMQQSEIRRNPPNCLRTIDI